jgi:hypothetical protein
VLAARHRELTDIAEAQRRQLASLRQQLRRRDGVPSPSPSPQPGSLLAGGGLRHQPHPQPQPGRAAGRPLQGSAGAGAGPGQGAGACGASHAFQLQQHAPVGPGMAAAAAAAAAAVAAAASPPRGAAAHRAPGLGGLGALLGRHRGGGPSGGDAPPFLGGTLSPPPLSLMDSLPLLGSAPLEGLGF